MCMAVLYLVSQERPRSDRRGPAPPSPWWEREDGAVRGSSASGSRHPESRAHPGGVEAEHEPPEVIPAHRHGDVARGRVQLRAHPDERHPLDGLIDEQEAAAHRVDVAGGT